MRYSITPITLALAEAEPHEDRIFGPSYTARQAALAERAASVVHEETTFVQMPVKPSRRHAQGLKRGTRVNVQVDKINPAEWRLVGRETMSSVGTVKTCRYGMAEVQWGCTRWWIDLEFVEVVE